jgi:hypothetical protein
MKLFISLLLQFPLFYVLANGFIALTGLNIWLSIPICVMIGLCYDIGEMFRKGEL